MRNIILICFLLQTAKAEEPESRYSSSSSLNSSSTPEITPSAMPLVTSNTNNPDWSENVRFFIKKICIA